MIRNEQVNDSIAALPILDESMEKHYSPEEIALMWSISTKTVRRLFANEPGIIELGRAESMRKRRYLTIRVPESVLMRVHRRLKKAG
jgi:hypothetical protein